VKPRQAEVIIRYADGGERSIAGMVVARETRTHGEVEWAGGKRKSYPTRWFDIRVILEDQTKEVMSGERRA
jgi:hypothetical protein